MYARFAAVATLAFVMTPACKKKAPESAAPAPQSVDVSLQVSSISPSAIAPDTSEPAKVFGARSRPARR